MLEFSKNHDGKNEAAVLLAGIGLVILGAMAAILTILYMAFGA